MNKSLLLVLPLMATVLVAGCVDLGDWGGGDIVTGGEGDGITVVSFSADQDSVQEGKSVRINLDLENHGNYEVGSGYGIVYLTGSNLVKDATSDSNWNLTSGNIIQNFSKTLKPADPARDIPPTRATLRWTISAPKDLSRGQEKTDSFIARTYYNYRTSGTGTIWVYSEAEEIAARDRDEELPKSSLTTTQGPLGLSMSVAPDPVVISSDEEIFTLYITLNNNGGGTIFNNTNRENIDYTKGTDLNSQDLNIEETFLNVPIIGIDGIEDLIVDSSCYLSRDNLELIGGSTVTLACDVRVTDSDVGVKKGFPITITADYGYYKDNTLEIKAVGK